MFEWLWRRRRLADQDGSGEVEYDPVYSLSRRALNEWLKWNPQLAVEHRRLEREAAIRASRRALTGQEARLETTLPKVVVEDSNGSGVNPEPSVADSR